MALVLNPERLELRKGDELKKLGAIYVDFVSGTRAHRHRFGGSCGEMVARAVSFKGSELLDVVDAAVGLGRDAFVLAALGLTDRNARTLPGNGRIAR